MKEFRERFNKPDFPVFSISDVKIAFKGKRISAAYVHLMLHNLVDSSQLTRITRGFYTFHKDAAVVGFAFAPFYYGLENALSIMGLSEQGTNFIIMSSRNVRTGVRSFQGRNYRIQHVQNKHMFGYRIMKYDGFWIPVSDAEKTLIDMVYFNDHIRNEVLMGLLDRIDRKRLTHYLESYNVAFKKRIFSMLDKPINSMIGSRQIRRTT